jgi:hypothetical protein
MDSIIEKISQDNKSDLKSLISFNSNKEDFVDAFWKQKEEFLSSIINTEEIKASKYSNVQKITEGNESKQKTTTAYRDNVILKPWKNTDNYSARLIDYSEDTVTIECLVDKENGVYEERCFRSNIFENYKLEIGKLFFLRFFERAGEVKMQIHDDPDLTLKEDFPRIKLSEKFKNSRLFK